MQCDQCGSSTVPLPPHSDDPTVGAEQLLIGHLARPQEGDRSLVWQLGKVGAGEVTLASMVTWTKSGWNGRLKLFLSLRLILYFAYLWHLSLEW